MALIDLSSGDKQVRTGRVFLLPEQLKEIMAQPRIKVIDVRSAGAYVKGHIAGAVSIPSHLLQVPERDGLRNKWAADSIIEEVFSRAGLTYDDDVVLYGEGSLDPGASFAIFSYTGFDALHVLDGGFGAWEGGRDSLPIRPAPSEFIMSRKNSALWIGKEDLNRRIGEPGVVIVESRAREAYDDGHIPTAKHHDPPAYLEDGIFLKPRDMILRSLADKGITPDRQIILSCGSGGAASQNYMVLKDIGFSNVLIYLNAWDEWSIDTSKIQELAAPNVTFSGSIINNAKSLGPYFFSQDELQPALNSQDVLLLDVRPEADFDKGRIPGAVHVYWADTLDDHRNPKPVDELLAMLSKKGVTPDRHVVIFTRGGLQLTCMYVLLKLLGYPRISAYTGRWDGWEIPSWLEEQ